MFQTKNKFQSKNNVVLANIKVTGLSRKRWKTRVTNDRIATRDRMRKRIQSYTFIGTTLYWEQKSNTDEMFEAKDE